MSYYQEQVEKHGCEHVGTDPENFDCVDCEDNCAHCNCFEGMGVFCNRCEKILSLSCDAIRWAHEQERRKRRG